MKMKITVEVENDDGSKTINPVVIDTVVPDFDEFKGPDNSRNTFNKLEKARNGAAELAAEEYLAELSKKIKKK